MIKFRHVRGVFHNSWHCILFNLYIQKETNENTNTLFKKIKRDTNTHILNKNDGWSFLVLLFLL